jgi:ankyrin repeat protein
MAAGRDDLKTVKTCLKAGLDINGFQTPQSSFYMGFLNPQLPIPPLRQAAGYNAVEVLEYLISKGANVDQPDEKGETALMYAASYDVANCIQILLQANANVNAQSSRNGECLCFVFCVCVCVCVCACVCV